MKALVGIQGAVALAAWAVTTAAFAQNEQWLQYRTSQEPRGYRWIQLTNTPPADVALPKVSPKAVFGQWKTGLDQKGARWICVDRVAKSGPYDRLYIDSNGNGRLDDETPLKANRRDENMAYFDPVRLVFKGEDGPLTYHLLCQFYQYQTNRAELLTGSGGTYEGKVTFGGKKHTVQLVDNNVNGVFNDVAANPYDSDRIVVDGDDANSRYIGRYLELGKELFQIEVAMDGAFIKIKPATDVAMGQIRVPDTISEFTAVGSNGHFVRKPEKGEFTLPVGMYRVHAWTIDRKDAQGAKWQLSGSSAESGQFTVAAAQPVSVNVGEPVTPVLTATQFKGEFSYNLRFYGNLGETVQIMRGQDQPPPPQLHVASLTGSMRTTNNFQYG